MFHRHVYHVVSLFNSLNYYIKLSFKVFLYLKILKSNRICKVSGRHILDHVLALKIKQLIHFHPQKSWATDFLSFTQCCSEGSNEYRPKILQLYKDIIQVLSRRLLLPPKAKISQQAVQLKTKLLPTCGHWLSKLKGTVSIHVFRTY